MSLDEKDRQAYLSKKMESDRLITSYKNSLLKATDLLKSNPDGITIAGAMVIKYDNAAYIFTEGMDDDYMNLDPTYLIKWQIICDFNNLGFKYVNLDGIAGEFEGENNYARLNESKLGFNSTITEYIGEFDIVLNNFAYNWYKKTKK